MGFPCNQFGAQEPDSNAVIEANMKKDYNVTFLMLAKSNVNAPCTVPVEVTSCSRDQQSDPATCQPDSKLCCSGNNPVYAYLKSVLPGPILWNFEKVGGSRTHAHMPVLGQQAGHSRPARVQRHTAAGAGGCHPQVAVGLVPLT